jgi:hypothetical protein
MDIEYSAFSARGPEMLKFGMIFSLNLTSAEVSGHLRSVHHPLPRMRITRAFLSYNVSPKRQQGTVGPKFTCSLQLLLRIEDDQTTLMGGSAAGGTGLDGNKAPNFSFPVVMSRA